MKELFLEFAKQGAMTPKDLAGVLKRTYWWVLNHSGEEPTEKLIPRLPGKPVRFDPMRMIDVFCTPQKVTKPSSLTIGRHKTVAKPEGRWAKCL